MLPTDLFKKWKSKVHKIAKKIEESVSTHLKEINVETLKKHIKAWVEPTFMKHKENLEEEKQMVQGIFPNYTLYCVVVFFKYCDWNGVLVLFLKDLKVNNLKLFTVFMYSAVLKY